MKSKAFLVSLIALFALAFALTAVSAYSNVQVNCSDYVCITDVEVNGISYALDDVNEAVAGLVSETVPVAIKFTAMDDGDNRREEIKDVRVKVYIEGFKDEISDESERFHILEGNTYVKKFTLKLPSTMDLDELTEEKLSLLVRVSARGENSVEIELPLEVQKNLYSLNILSVEIDEVVNAGDTVAVDIVVENNGFDRLDDVYVKVSIPGLGVSKKMYAGDLSSLRDDFDDDVNDARERRVYLSIPRNAAPGNYEMEIEAYNYDTSVQETRRVIVRGFDTKALPPVTSKTVAPGEETTFDVVLVNRNNRMVIYTIAPQESKGFFVEATEPLVTIPADSSKSTKVKVVASEDVPEGTYVVTVNAVSESGETETINFTVNVKKDRVKVDGKVTVTDTQEVNTTVIITVILVIIFVVLLIILIVLLSKRPAESEEFGETNYY